jgi:hypothetical protein
VLAIDGLDLLVETNPTKLWGVRVANALEDDDHVERLLAALQSYQAHGINALTWFLQGGSSGTVNAFREDGALEAAYLPRMERLLDETARRGMVAIVGYFYQNRPLRPRTAAGVERAVAAATEWLRPYRHAIVNVANEYHAAGYDKTRLVFPFGDPAAINRLIDVVRATDPERIVGANAKGIELVLPVARHADLALHDDPGIAEELLCTYEVGKPVVDVECGGFALDIGHPGIFSRDAVLFYQAQVRSAQALRGKSVFFHAHWFQEPPRRFELGGYGTQDDPGVHWYFDLVAQVRGLSPCRPVRLGFAGRMVTTHFGPR